MWPEGQPANENLVALILFFVVWDSHTNWVFLTHWAQVMHKCDSTLTIISSDNGLLPDQHQAIIWTNDGILWIRPLGTNFSEILIEFPTFWFKKMHFNVSVKWQSFCLTLNVLKGLVFMEIKPTKKSPEQPYD